MLSPQYVSLTDGEQAAVWTMEGAQSDFVRRTESLLSQPKTKRPPLPVLSRRAKFLKNAWATNKPWSESKEYTIQVENLT